MPADPLKTRPLDNWMLCRQVEPQSVRASGLVMVKDFDKDVVTEGVAEVLVVGPGKLSEETGLRLDPGVKPGDRVLYRGFLRFAVQVGTIYGATSDTEYFLMKSDDALAVVSGEGTLGYYGEYVL